MKFVTLDFETANRNRNSPCEVGVSIVENNAVVETRSWLIRPRPLVFDFFNTMVHGISRGMVENEPEFDAVWNELLPILDGQFVIAHNAGFDMSVLRATLDHHQLPHPDFEYACSYLFSKRVWPESPSYGLHDLCSAQGIVFDHHRAGPDSRATAQLCLKAFEVFQIERPEDISSKLQTVIGNISPGSFKPSRTKRASLFVQPDARTIVGDVTKHDVDSIFYGAAIVFTGTLSSMTRGEAQQLVADIGGIVANGVTKVTNFLVVGQQDVRLVGDDGLSGKQEKAIQLRAKGHEIELMSEADFLSSIQNEVSLALTLALRHADAQNIPSRYRRGSSSGSGTGKAQEGIELRFNQEVALWEALITSMRGHLGEETATRYLMTEPLVTLHCESLTECVDFVEFNDYVQRRRDVDSCSDDELGQLALLLTELQKAAQRRIRTTIS